LKGGAIINLSSLASAMPMVYIEMYSASKFWNLYLSNCMNISYGNDVDFLGITPAYVSTPLTKNMKISNTVATPDECAYDSLCYLGRTMETVGSWKHVLE